MTEPISTLQTEPKANLRFVVNDEPTPMTAEERNADDEAHYAAYIEYLNDLAEKEFEAELRLEAAQSQYDTIRAKVEAVHNPEQWRDLFHTREEIEKTPPISFAIENFLQDDTITVLAGLPGHGKTLVALAMAQALLDGRKLFGHFPVNRESERLIYLVPESALTPFKERLKTFRLVEHIGERLFVRTLSAKGEHVSITDPRLLEAVEGADVMLDTAIRFLPPGTDENNAGQMRLFSAQLFGLLQAGAKTVTPLHHSPKATNDASLLTLENVLRGSGDLGGMCATAWATYQLDADSCTLFLCNVKARDFQASPALVLEGRPHLDETSEFKLITADCKGLPSARQLYGKSRGRGGRPANPQKPEKLAFAKELREAGRTYAEIANEIGVSPDLARKWLVRF